MTLTVVSRLTTKSNKTFNTVEEWMVEHGPCGLHNPITAGGSIDIDSPTSVIRTMIFEVATDWDILRAGKPSEQPYIVEPISQTES